MNPRAALHGMIESQDWTEVMSLLKVYDGAARMPTQVGILPLHLALINKCPEQVLNELINCYELGTTLQTPDKHQYPLSLALSSEVSYTDDIMLKLVSSESCSSSSKNAVGDSPLISAIARKGSARLIDGILKSNPEAASIVDEMEALPILLAVKGKLGAEALKMIYEAYKKGIEVKGDDGEVVENLYGLW